MDVIHKILRSHNTLTHSNQGIQVAKVRTKDEGISLAEEIITTLVDSKTLLLLSGGKTPKDLYSLLATADSFLPGAVGLVDERYGEKWHESSNEKMIRDSGLLRYIEMRGLPFYPILQKGLSREESAEEYDEKLRSLFAVYPKTVATFGVGSDGHTAGIAGNRKGFVNPIFDPSEKDFFVGEFNDLKGILKERVTMTFLGLSMIDFFIGLVFGNEKKEALDLMFDSSAGGGSEVEIPARFFKRPQTAKKTLLITDQNI